MSSVVVIDYGMGNLHSISKALQQADATVSVQISADSKVIRSADRVVFPGVGAMPDCIQAIQDANLMETIKDIAKQKPFLGICLGMQALLTDSTEGGLTPSLDIFKGHVIRFANNLIDAEGNRLKIPHMGWNQVKQKAHPLWHDIPQNSRFYFVHSYYFAPEDPALTLGESEYPERFSCIVGCENVFATQFHTEKSHRAGLQMMKNFLAWDGTV
jgi:glutamine amidotransferase